MESLFQAIEEENVEALKSSLNETLPTDWPIKKDEFDQTTIQRVAEKGNLDLLTPLTGHLPPTYPLLHLEYVFFIFWLE